LMLGLFYRDGLGVPQDDQAALTWLLKAAQQGNADAQNKLGIVYLQGQGVIADAARAGVWFSRAAEQGDRAAQANLAALYETGRGVPRDLMQAYRWYLLSQRGSHTDRSDELRQLANLMSAEQIAVAERMATEWRTAQTRARGTALAQLTDLLE